MIFFNAAFFFKVVRNEFDEKDRKIILENDYSLQRHLLNVLSNVFTSPKNFHF